MTFFFTENKQEYIQPVLFYTVSNMVVKDYRPGRLNGRGCPLTLLHYSILSNKNEIFF